jgi:hypothetical protein
MGRPVIRTAQIVMLAEVRNYLTIFSTMLPMIGSLYFSLL